MIKENQIGSIVEKAKKLFASKMPSKEEKILEGLGVYNSERTYSTDFFKINAWIDVMPSQVSFYAKLDEISKKRKDILLKTTEKDRDKLLREKEDLELEVIKEQYGQLVGKEKQKPRLFFGLGCEPVEHLESLDLKVLGKSSHVNKILDAIETFAPRSVILRNCVNLDYSNKDFKLTGGFPLPTKIPLPERVVSRLGEANVSGFVLSFKDSPLGIKTIEIRKRKDEIAIFAAFSSKMHVTRKILQQVYERGVQTADLFVEAI